MERGEKRAARFRLGWVGSKLPTYLGPPNFIQFVPIPMELVTELVLRHSTKATEAFEECVDNSRVRYPLTTGFSSILLVNLSVIYRATVSRVVSLSLNPPVSSFFSHPLMDFN